MEPFEPRSVDFRGLHRTDGWRLKLYSILYGPGTINLAAFGPGIALAEAALPKPAVRAGRSGAGFLITHQGRTGNYAVRRWWDRENELPLRVFVSPDRLPESWRPAGQRNHISNASPDSVERVTLRRWRSAKIIQTMNYQK